jgi:hypothetical protein
MTDDRRTPGPAQPWPGAQPPARYGPPPGADHGPPPGTAYGPAAYGPAGNGPAGYGPAGPQYPPYPPPPYPPPAPHSQPTGRPTRTGYARVLGATAVWAALNTTLAVIVAGSQLTPRAAGYVLGTMLIPVLLGALITWLVVRRRSMSFWILVLAAAPAFWVLRLLFGALRATSGS